MGQKQSRRTRRKFTPESKRGEREGVSGDERARLGELEAENAKLRMERDLLKTNRGLLCAGDIDAVTRYRCVDARKADGFPVAAACAAAGCRPRRITPGPYGRPDTRRA